MQVRKFTMGRPQGREARPTAIRHRPRWPGSVHRARVLIVTGRRIQHRVNHVAVFEIHDEIGVFPAIDGRMFGRIAAAWGKFAQGRAVFLLDLGHGLATSRQVHAFFVLYALGQRLLGMGHLCCGKAGADGDRCQQGQVVTVLEHGSPLRKAFAASLYQNCLRHATSKAGRCDVGGPWEQGTGNRERQVRRKRAGHVFFNKGWI
jgi:hypothetical protein